MGLELSLDRLKVHPDGPQLANSCCGPDHASQTRSVVLYGTCFGTVYHMFVGICLPVPDGLLVGCLAPESCPPQPHLGI